MIQSIDIGAKCVDAQAMAVTYPDTFEAPSHAALEAVRPGDFLKICHGNERFWTVCSSRRDGSWDTEFVAQVDNKLTAEANRHLVVGRYVRFRGRHVYEVTPWEAVAPSVVLLAGARPARRAGR